jgi:serine/threonine protein kinase
MNLIGRVILNQIRVDAFVASGGMGVVYRVLDMTRNVPLAMKVLHTELAEDPSIFRRFQREARALEKLAHPNIVAFYGLYRTQDFAFLLERFIDGPSLNEILKQERGQPLAFQESLIYLKALCAALGYAHHHGVVHCDVKPGNVMVDQGGNVYLTDFGIARHADSTTTTLATVGTSAYMAPEQIRGDAVSPATDVYALGVVLFEMLTGQRPFRGNESGTESAGATANERVRYAHMKLSPPDPRNLNPSIPPLLSQVILKALSKEPNQRLPSTQAFYTAVCASLQTNPEHVPDRITTSSLPTRSFEPSAAPPSSADVAIGTFTPGEKESREQPHKEKRPMPFGAKGAFLLGGFLVAILIVILLSEGGPSPTETATPNPVGALVTTETSSTPLNSTPTAPQQANSADLSTAAAMTVIAQFTDISSAPTKTPLPPTPTSPPADSRPVVQAQIAFVKGPPGNTDIYIASAEGNQIYPITNNQCDEAEPDWSPDGQEVIYHSNCDGAYNLWKININGGPPTQLTRFSDQDLREPDWSPYGDQIAYRRNPRGENRNSDGEIWVMNADGKNHQFLGIFGRSPVWSPNGEYLAFMSEQTGRWQIYVFELTTKLTSKITDCEVNCRWPDWSPNSQYVAFNSTTAATNANPDSVLYVSRSGGNPFVLVSNGVGRPSWSKTGFIVFNSNAGIEIISEAKKNRKVIVGYSDAWAPDWSR